MQHKIKKGNQVCSNILHHLVAFVPQDVLSFLGNQRENQSSYKGSRIAVSVSFTSLSKLSAEVEILYNRHYLVQDCC